MRLVRLLAVLAFAGATLVPTSSASAQTLPPTLTGETLVNPSAPGPSPNPPQITANCNPFGPSTISYTTSGTALGPYPGTFTESGTATIATTIFGNGPVTSFNASYTINSAAGTVTGTKTLTAPGNLSNNFGFCQPGGLIGFGVTTTYQAQIDAGGQSYADNGVTDAALNSPALGLVGGAFDENFYSSLQQVIPLCIEDEQANQNEDGDAQGCANP